MTHLLSRRAVLAATCIACSAVALPALAQDYPSRPVKVIVPVAPGGLTDILARQMVERLTQRLGQSFIVENRAGGGYVIGMQAAARAPADGYTLVLTNRGAMAVNPFLHKNLPYDPLKDFEPIALVAAFPLVLAVHPSLPVRSVPELLDYVRRRPGEVSFASSGNATSSHLAMELLQRQAGVKMMHIPYKGSGPAMQDLLGGSVQLSFDSLTVVMPQVQAGKLRALAIANPQRSPLMPQLPTVSEGGVKGFDMSGWYGLAAPAGTPKPIINRLQTEVMAMMNDPAFRNALMAKGIEPIGKDSTAFAALVRSDLQRWEQIVKDASLRIE